MGAYSFVFGLQPLAKGRLNLAAWHGFQEVIWKEVVDPASAEFDFFLTPGSYLVFLFDKTEEGYSGIRLSKSGRFPPMVFSASPEGEFIRKEKLTGLRRAAASNWQTLRVEFSGDGFSVFLNDRQLKSFQSSLTRPHRIGFRGGRRDAFVDNLRVVERDGNVLRETFSVPHNWPLVNALSIGAVLLFSTLLCLVLRKFLPVSEELLLGHFSMFTMVLIVIGSMLYGFQYFQSRFYPDESQKPRRLEDYHRGETAQEIYSRIEEEHPPAPAEGTHRLLFIGSSQTWGAGSVDESETWVRVVERLLNASPGTERFECINTAVSATKMRGMARMFYQRWIALKPRTVVVIASHSDTAGTTSRFEGRLGRVVRVSLKAGIQPVLIMEPNSVENDTQSLLRHHAAMARVAEAPGVPILDMHSYLAERYDDGFLWWDQIHLTSFGHQLFAHRLFEELIKLGLVGVDPPPALRIDSGE